MVNFWDVTVHKEEEGRREITRKPAHVLPVFEAVHAMCLLPNKLLAVVGEEGTTGLLGASTDGGRGRYGEAVGPHTSAYL